MSTTGTNVVSPPGSGRRPWSWREALGVARPGSRYRVTGLLFHPVRDRCREIGCWDGDVLLCVDRQDGSLILERADGGRIQLEREHAWFVQVEPVDRSADV